VSKQKAACSFSRLFSPTGQAISLSKKSIVCDEHIAPFKTAVHSKRLRSAFCRTTFTRFGRCRSTTQIFRRAGTSSRVAFSRGLDARPRSLSQATKREKGIWQRRYWGHAIRDDADLERHVDYVHFNPVKHGHVARVLDWPHSSFHRFVERGLLAPDWGGDLRDMTGSFGE
jgi:REP element-mobilizing transposase RayT